MARKISSSQQRDLMIKACSLYFMQRLLSKRSFSVEERQVSVMMCGVSSSTSARVRCVWPLKCELACECDTVSSVCCDFTCTRDVRLIRTFWVLVILFKPTSGLYQTGQQQRIVCLKCYSMAQGCVCILVLVSTALDPHACMSTIQRIALVCSHARIHARLITRVQMSRQRHCTNLKALK